MTEYDSKEALIERVQTGVPGLDAILHGGFFRGSVSMVIGSPGAGKTILANQACFRHVAAGGRAVFVTLLTESHARMLLHLQSFEFFDASKVGTSLFYISGYDVLEKEKLKGLLSLIQQIVHEHDATLLVIDGMVMAGSLAESVVEVKKFIHELQTLVALVGCTTLLLTGSNPSGEDYPQRTMVDGIVELTFEAVGMGTSRTIEVVKFRGSDSLLGRHIFEIVEAGIAVYPRTESHLGRSAARPGDTQPALGFGIASLDEMLGGGLRPGSMTMVLGTPGIGKTLLGLSFLANGARAKEPGLYFGFFETEAELVRKAAGVGTDLAGFINDGLIQVLWQPPFGLIADALAEKVLSVVKERGIRRLFIDGLGGFKDALVYPERAAAFFGALCNELRALGVATIVSDETRRLYGPEVEVPVQGLTAALDNIVFLRAVEERAQRHKLISVLKMREGAGDSSLREFSISNSGIDVSATFASAQALLPRLSGENGGEEQGT